MSTPNAKINQDANINLGRRRMLQATTALVAAPVVLGGMAGVAFGQTPAAGNVSAGNGKLDLPLITKKRTLGRGRFSMEVSALGFGCMGANYHRGVFPDRSQMIALMRQAAEHGVTLFDTAQIYGPLTNEELVGEALAPYKNKVAVTTKFGFRFINGVNQPGETDSRPETIKRVADECLQRLRIDAIDLFYQHRFDPQVPIEDVAGAVKDLIQAGKVKRFGLCEVGPDVIRRAHAVQPVTAIQSEYHLMWREPEQEILPLMQELGIGFVPYSPINRGFLGGDMTEYTRFDTGSDNRNILPRFTPEALRHNLMFVEMLNRFGRPRGITGAQTALAWLMQKADWIVPIPGTTKMAHLEENLRAADISCTDAEWKELEDSLANIQIMGDRYPQSEQRNIQR